MLALSFDGPGNVEVVERPAPRIVDDSDAIVRVTTTAIGPRDLARFAGPDPWPGTIPGGEFCGEVNEVGAGVASIDLGDLVTGLGVFDTVRGRLRQVQRQAFGWSDLNGGQALYVRVPDADNTLLKVPTAAIEERAVLLGDTFGLGASAVDLALAGGASRICVIGCDPYGASALIALAVAGIENVIALDNDDRRRGLARRLGAVTFDTSTPEPDKIGEAMKEATGGDGPDAVILGSGADIRQLELALRTIQPDGVLVLTEPELPGAVLPVVANERNISIRRATPPTRAHSSRAMLDLWGGTLDLGPLVSHVMPLVDAAQGYRQLHAREPGAHKILLKT